MLGARESAASIGVTLHWRDHLFRRTSPLTGFQPLAALRGSPLKTIQSFARCKEQLNSFRTFVDVPFASLKLFNDDRY